MLLLLLLLQCMHEKSLGKQINPATKLLCNTLHTSMIKAPLLSFKVDNFKDITANLLELEF